MKKKNQYRKKAWLVRDRVGKMHRGIFFCGKDLVPADDRHDRPVRVIVSYSLVKRA